MAELSKEMQAAIDNYADRVKTLKDFMTAVQKRPTMYLGSLNRKGCLNASREIFQNSIDQILDPKSPGNWFKYCYDERTNEVTVIDNGAGLPFSDIVRILTTQHTSKNYDRKPGEYPSGYNGVGAKIVNALSSSYIVESYKYDGTAVRVEFVNGYPTTKDPVKIPNKDKYQGLKTSYILNPEIMGDTNMQWKDVYHLIKLMMSTLPIGSKCTFEAIDINGKVFTEEIVNKDGIITSLIMNVKNPLNKPIIVSADDGYHKLEAAFCYDSIDETDNGDVSTTSFCNSCPTIGGTHVDGTIDGITRWFSNYMNTIFLANQKAKDKLKVLPIDIKGGLNIFINAAHIEPEFQDQSKEILGNTDMTPFCKETVMKGLDTWSKANPQDLARLCKFFKDIAELRMRSEAGKAKIATKYTKNPVKNLPAKYIRPLKEDHVELIIVEGDSALGTVQEARDNNTQGLYPIRGKIANAFKMSKQAFFANEEVQAITQIIFGQEYKKGLTIEDAKVEKIIFMADADVDGAHIAALLLRMFIMYFPFLIQAGMVYKAVPPLYSTKDGKKNRYFTEQIDIVKYVQKNFLATNTFTTVKKEELSSKDITLFFLTNTDYVYYLEKLSNSYGIDTPALVEMVLYHYISGKMDVKKLQKDIKSVYRFMDAYQDKDSIVIKGTINMSNLIIFNDKFIKDSREIIDVMKKNRELFYMLNGKKASIYNIMKSYKAAEPKNIQRFKGLGEMNDDQLAESTLYPGSDRTLIRYTLEDAKETLNLVRDYESDTKKILGEVGIVTRDDLLD